MADLVLSSVEGLFLAEYYCYTGFIMADDQNPPDPQTPTPSSDSDSPISPSSPPSPQGSSTIPEEKPVVESPQASVISEEPKSTLSTESTEAQALVDSPPLSASPADIPAASSPSPLPAEAQALEDSSVPEPPVSSPTSANLPNPPSEQAVISEEKPPETPPQQSDLSTVAAPVKEDTNVSLPDNQAAQVQSEAPSDASANQPPQQTEKMAEIKLEPPQSPTMPSTPPENVTPSTPNVSFGDLLSSSPPSSPPPSDRSNLSTPSDLPVSSPPNPQPITNNPFTSPKPDVSSEGGQPSSSFGDLIKDIKPEESVIQPPPIPSEPTTPPIVSPTNPPRITNNPPPISSPSPISPLSPISPPIDLEAKLKEALSVRRQKANQKRHQKKEERLDKLVRLVQTRGKITNREAQKILHLPQSTLTDYFKELVTSGRLKIFGKKRGVYYTV